MSIKSKQQNRHPRPVLHRILQYWLLVNVVACLSLIMALAGPSSAGSATNTKPQMVGVPYRLSSSRVPDDPGGPDDVKISDNTYGPTKFYGAQLLHACSADPYACGPRSISYSETVTINYQIWQRRDGVKPTLYYVINNISLNFIEHGYPGSDFSPAGYGNHLTIYDQNPCGGDVNSTVEDSKAQFIPSSIDPSTTSGADNSYEISTTFLRPTVHVDAGALFNEDWENGGQGFNLPVNVPFTNACN